MVHNDSLAKASLDPLLHERSLHNRVLNEFASSLAAAIRGDHKKSDAQKFWNAISKTSQPGQ